MGSYEAPRDPHRARTVDSTSTSTDSVFYPTHLQYDLANIARSTSTSVDNKLDSEKWDLNGAFDTLTPGVGAINVGVHTVSQLFVKCRRVVVDVRRCGRIECPCRLDFGFTELRNWVVSWFRLDISDLRGETETLPLDVRFQNHLNRMFHTIRRWNNTKIGANRCRIKADSAPNQHLLGLSLSRLVVICRSRRISITHRRVRDSIDT